MILRPLKIFQYFAIPDKFFSWLPSAYKTGRRIIEKENIKVIYATAPYFSGLVLGWLLSQKTGAKLVVEFRDPWTTNLNWYNRFFISSFFDKILKKKILEQSTIIIAVTDGIKKILEKSLTGITSKIVVISNGFDSENLPEIKPNEIFTLTYAGTLKDDRKKFLKIFLSALAALFKERVIEKEKIKIKFLGDKPHFGQFTKELSGLIEYSGYTDYLTSLKKQGRSAVLLFFDNKICSASVPAKIYEYFFLSRPILAFTYPESPVAKIIKETNAGFCLFGEKEAKNIILTLYNNFYSEGKIEYHPNFEELKKFSYSILTKKINNCLEKVLKL